LSKDFLTVESTRFVDGDISAILFHGGHPTSIPTPTPPLPPLPPALSNVIVPRYTSTHVMYIAVLCGSGGVGAGWSAVENGCDVTVH
jgi:hypothetical protein